MVRYIMRDSIGIALFCAAERPHQVKRNKTVIPTAQRFRCSVVIAYSTSEAALPTGLLGWPSLLHPTEQEMRFSPRAA
jgi:hypothetical protein